jgi:hypothetical protein
MKESTHPQLLCIYFYYTVEDVNVSSITQANGNGTSREDMPMKSTSQLEYNTINELDLSVDCRPVRHQCTESCRCFVECVETGRKVVEYVEPDQRVGGCLKLVGLSSTMINQLVITATV